MMKKIVYSFLFTLLLFSCGKEEGTLSPSNAERNWLVIEDEGDCEIDRLRYKIFKETGIPIYYNDTIGSDERFDMNGRSYTYYECLQVFYYPNTPKPDLKTAYFRLAEDKNQLLSLVKFIENDILSEISKQIYIPSLLLVDTLKTPVGDSITHKGLNTIVIGEALAFDTKSEVEKANYKGTIISSLVGGHLMNAESKWLEDKFFELTYRTNRKATAIYSTEVKNGRIAVYRAWAGAVPEVPAEMQRLDLLGFITGVVVPGRPEREWKTPTRAEDIKSYCEVLFTYTQEEIEAKYGGVKVVMDKFKAVRTKLAEYGYEF